MRYLLLSLALACTLPARAAEPVLLILGDSLSAAYGIDPRAGWVALLEQRLRDQGRPHHVINASVSGDTSGGGLHRLPALLERHHPEVLVIELGANDGLRGLSFRVLEQNLSQMVRLGRAAGANVVLLGQRMPPNYGPAFNERFHAVYRRVAEREGAVLVPFFLEGVGEDLDQMLADGLHPRAKAQPRLLDNVWPFLAPLL